MELGSLPGFRLLSSLLVFTVMLWLSGCQSLISTNNNKERPLLVEIHTLHASPHLYAGKRVRLKGYIVLERARCSLWPSQESFDSQGRDVSQSVWIILNNGKCYSVDYMKKFSRRGDVTVTGVYNPNSYGHLGIYPASLQQVEIESL